MRPCEVTNFVSACELEVQFPDGEVCRLRLAEAIPASDYAAFKLVAPVACEVGLGHYDATEEAFMRSSVRFAPLSIELYALLMDA
jgi:hypothetical protein